MTNNLNILLPLRVEQRCLNLSSLVAVIQKSFPICVLLCAICGCSQTPVIRTYSGPQRPLPHLAVVLMENQSAIVAAVDGKTVRPYGYAKGAYSAEVHLLPGEHILSVRYSVQDVTDISYILDAGLIPIQARFEPNRVYFLKFKPNAAEKQVHVELQELGSLEIWGALLGSLKNSPAHWDSYAEKDSIQRMASSDPSIVFALGCYTGDIKEYTAAYRLFEIAKSRYSEQEGTRWHEALCAGNMGECLLKLAKCGDAEECYREALTLSEGMNEHKRQRGYWKIRLGSCMHGRPSDRVGARALMEEGFRDVVSSPSAPTLALGINAMAGGGNLLATLGCKCVGRWQSPMSRRLAPVYQEYQYQERPGMYMDHRPPYVPPAYIPPPYIPPPYIPPPFIP